MYGLMEMITNKLVTIFTVSKQGELTLCEGQDKLPYHAIQNIPSKNMEDFLLRRIKDHLVSLGLTPDFFISDRVRASGL